MSGSGVPSSGVGVVSDWYLNTSNGDVYEKTGASTWTLRDNITGPPGNDGADGSNGVGVPTGGSAGQILRKIDGVDYNTEWGDQSSGFSRSVSEVSTNTSAGATASTDYVYLASNTITITLPTAVGNSNRYTIKNVGAGVITIATTSGQTIDGAANAQIHFTNNSVDLISTGSNWKII
jgi:hypothetical protein